MKIKARIEFVPNDLWIGCYWKRSSTKWIQDEDQDDGAIWRPRKAERLHLWLCLLPCLPLHVMFHWNERLLSEEETLEDMIQF